MCYLMNMICLQVLEVRNMDEPMDIDYLSQGYFVNQNINLDFLFIYHQQIFLDIVQNTTVVRVFYLFHTLIVKRFWVYIRVYINL